MTPMDEEPEAAPQDVDLPAAAEGGRSGRTVAIALGVGLVAWMVGAVLVMFWQPGRFTQLGLIAGAVVVALLIPRRHFDRILAAFGVLVVFAALFYLPSYLLTSEVEFTIRNTDRDSSRETYLVHTDYGAKTESDPGETFENIDQPLLQKVNSSDVQGQAETLRGRRVRARVFGFRIADFSRYRNIVWIRALEPAAPLGAPPTATPAEAPD